jgi:hypothetical protein
LSKTYRNPVFQLWRKYMTVGFVKQCGLIKWVGLKKRVVPDKYLPQIAGVHS